MGKFRCTPSFQGSLAYSEGFLRDQNPYTPGYWAWRLWDNGWMEAKQDAYDAMRYADDGGIA